MVDGKVVKLSVCVMEKAEELEDKLECLESHGIPCLHGTDDTL